MSEQDGAQATTIRRPPPNDPEAWKAYWIIQGQPWRTEPEIDVERQKYLAERRNIIPDIEKGIYPFKDIEPKLTRADVEWLLATHENGRGPVDWHDESQRRRKGLDLRGAILKEENLSGLPLARMLGGIRSTRQVSSTSEPVFTTTDQRNIAAVHMEGANLEGAHLEGANLSRSHLNRANIRRAHLERTELFFAHLEEAFLSHAHLERATLRGSNLEGTILYKAYLASTDLRRTLINNKSNLEGICLWDKENGYASLADISWGGANLTLVDWTQVKFFGDELRTRQLLDEAGNEKSKNALLNEYQSAIRAYRQLAVALRNEGLNEEADYFAYRAQKLQHIVLRRQRKFGRYLFFGLLDLLAGYGYRPGRSVVWYLIIIAGFALTYHLLGGLSLLPPDAFVFSVMSFHGRGFFPSLSSETNLHNPLVMLAAAEAIVGLLIEISFIATFTQRFFGR